MRKMKRLKLELKYNSVPLTVSSNICNPIVTPYGMENVQFKKREEETIKSSKQKDLPKEKKQYQHLCLMERKIISKMLRKGFCLSAIARELGRGKQAIAHEVRRNGGREMYNPIKAQKLSVERKIERDIKCSDSIKKKLFKPTESMVERLEIIEMQIQILSKTVKEIAGVRN